jgi:hypothetical protein
VDRDVHRLQVELPGHGGAPDGLAQSLHPDHPSQVHQRTSNRGDCDPVSDFDLLRFGITATPAADAVDLPPRLDGNGHVDQRRDLSQSP